MKQELVEAKQTLAVFDPVKAQIAEWKEESRKLVFDYEDEQGNKDARSHIFILRKLKGEVARIHKEAKADALAYGRRLDAKKNEYTADVEEMINYHYEPIKAIEDRETARREEIARKIEAEREAEEAKRQADLEAREKAVREAEEKQQAEKEAKEQAEREKLIAENAKKEAEESAKQALIDAEKKRLADIEAVKQKAKAEADAKELAALQAKQKEEKRAANVKHREKIEQEIYNALVDVMDSSAQVGTVFEAIKRNDIPHVTIQY